MRLFTLPKPRPDPRPGFIKNVPALVYSFPDKLLLFFRHMYYFLTGRTATPIEFYGTFIALDKQEMTAFVGTVDMGICRLSTLVTRCYNFMSYPLSQPVVEHKIFSMEPGRKIFIPDLVYIIDDAALQVKYIPETLV